MAKITFIGGGSAKFVSGLVRDLFTFEALRDSHIALMDIDPERMDRSARLIRKMIADLKLPAAVETTPDQARALDGADYVIVTVMVGGFKHYESDGAIPVKYGVLPTVGDTTGPGAVMRLIGTAPVVQEIVRNRGLIENLPPQAVVEVPCHVDACGVRPCRVGAIPLPLAAVMTPHILLHEMAIQAVLTKDRRMIRQAIQADPMTGAVLTVPQIRRLADELMEANAEYMHDWPRG